MAKSLGKLKRFSLQEFWGEDFEKFSSWLIQEEILEMIGEAIEVELTPAKDDMPVGVLKGGVVAKNVKNDTYVIIQGQLAGITHGDFGKLITYAAGLDAAVVVWVASKIPDEHRKAFDWLNDVSREDISFYGAELELWRIDDSAPAPNFNLVCQPNQWARSLKLDHGEGAKLDGEDSEETEVEAPQEKKEPVAQRKGDWSKKPSEKPASSQSAKSPAQSKDGVSVRENFVYTKSL